MITRLPYLLLLFVPLAVQAGEHTVSVVDESEYSIAKDRRYVLYDVNAGEGFNLRRDVYMRVAIAVRQMRQMGENVMLVLPPWGPLYHWRTIETRLPWSAFFDVQSLNEFVPVIEFDEFLQETSGRMIDRVVYLQAFAEGWGEGFVEKSEKRACIDGDRYYKKTDGALWKGRFYEYKEVRAAAFECVSMQGDSQLLAEIFVKNYTDTSILFDRAETALHEYFGEKEYWRARRSMRYAKKLVDIAAEYRAKHLDSNDEDDGTALPERWMDEKPRRSARGGAYIGVHVRRRDFVGAQGNRLPSLKGVAAHVTKLAKKYNVSKVFVATDSDADEIKSLKKALKPIKMYVFERSEDDGLNDGQATIIEQIICANARAFVGTHLSTVSFRIQEDREIRGFPIETTFKRMCADKETECEQPSKWPIKY